MFGDSWHMLRKVLSHDIEIALDGYWNRIRREEQEGFVISHSAEVCCYAVAPISRHCHDAQGTRFFRTLPRLSDAIKAP